MIVLWRMKRSINIMKRWLPACERSFRQNWGL